MREAVERLTTEGYQHTGVRFKMSDTSGPHRNEVLESNVGEMEAELFPTRAQIELMMNMIQRLLQAKSTYKGQQEEKSGVSGRRDANDDNGGAGRAPREEGACYESLERIVSINHKYWNHGKIKGTKAPSSLSTSEMALSLPRRVEHPTLPPLVVTSSLSSTATAT